MATIDSVKLPDNSTYDVADNYSGYQKATLTTPLTINGIQKTNVEGALGGLNDYADALKTAISNKNLVDNPWFTVNQRGATTVTSGYGADRWKFSGGNEAVFSSSGVTLNSVLISQLFEKQLPNGVFTASALFSDGTIRKGTATKSNDTSAVRLVDDADFKLTYEPSLQRFDINTAGMSSGLTVRASKLEVGTVSTLANDVEPNYTAEWLKCRRYFKRILSGDLGLGIAVTTTLFDLFVANDVPMRNDSPTVVLAGTISLLDTAGTITGATIVEGATNASLKIRFTSSSNMTTGAVSRVQLAGYIDIIDDL